jgi:hypothetical protein
MYRPVENIRRRLTWECTTDIYGSESVLGALLLIRAQRRWTAAALAVVI